MNKTNTSLVIRDFELSVLLGWTPEERTEAQIVRLDMEIHFAAPPKACTTDTLEDTVCYAHLLETLREKITNKEFKLIEHLACDIYHLIKKQLPKDAHLSVHLGKRPKLEGLMGPVYFSYSET